MHTYLAAINQNLIVKQAGNFSEDELEQGEGEEQEE